ncbi:MAG TPA: methyltransferase domain-containing protein [Gaiellaceae bacterium]|nr:methyltransferase domain-containing protein [Gaiellaceae bacterium]
MRPAPSDRVPAEDFHSDRYSEENVAFWVPLLVEVGGIGPDHRVLDVGCGTGGFTVAIAERTGAEVVGCDRSAALLEHAKKASAAAEWVEGSAERLPFADESFNRVLMSLMLHQVDEPAQAVAEAFRVLRRPGALVVRTVLPDDAAARVPFRFFPTLARVQAEQMPSLEELTAWMGAAGFDRIRSRQVLRNKRLELDTVEAQLRKEMPLRYPFLAQQELEEGLHRMRVTWAGRPDPRPVTFVVAEKR